MALVSEYNEDRLAAVNNAVKIHLTRLNGENSRALALASQALVQCAIERSFEPMSNRCKEVSGPNVSPNPERVAYEKGFAALGISRADVTAIMGHASSAQVR